MNSDTLVPCFYQKLAEQVVSALENNTAPWLKKWQSMEFVSPMNPVSGATYSGANYLKLAMELNTAEIKDPRIVTYKQAQAQGWQVPDGKHGCAILFTKFDKTERPQSYYSYMFNASQVEGMPALNKEIPSAQKSSERLQNILANSGSKNLNELVHKKDILNNESGPLGSKAYARSELRASIATLMLSSDLGLAYAPPKQNASYAQDWIKIIKEDYNELHQACRDAEKIRQTCLGFEQNKVQKNADNAKDENIQPIEHTNKAALNISAIKTYLQVPFEERNEAKNLGADWDRKAKLWFVPAGTDLTPFDKWSVENQSILKEQAAKAPVMSPEEEFAKAIAESGLDLKGQLPIMDGQTHRVALFDAKSNTKDGSYRGYLDGRPAGYIQNFKTGESYNWKYSGGHKLSKEQVELLKVTAAEQRKQSEQNLLADQAKVAKRCYAFWKDEEVTKWAKDDQPYLAAKQVKSFGVKVDAQGNLIVPGRDVGGFMHTLQTITPDCKRFEAKGRKSGTFHTIDPERTLGQKPILVAEGYATAASIHMATSLPCIAAFDAGNLLPVVKALREQYPDKPIIIMADDDHTQENNPGLQKAQKAAEAVNGHVISPKFTEEEKSKGLTDFNDLHVSRGIAEVNNQTSAIINVVFKEIASELKSEQTQNKSSELAR